MQRQLNFKLVGSLFAGASVAMLGVHVVHGYQKKRNADVLLVQAERAENDGKPIEAIGRYWQYLKNHDNAEAYEKLSALLMTEAMRPDATRRTVSMAFDKCEEALRLHPDLVPVRRRLAELLLARFGRIGDAMKQFEELRKNNRDDVQLDLRIAQCHAALGQVDRALRLFYDVLGYNDTTHGFDVETPRAAKELDAYMMLADLLKRKFEDSEQADRVVAQMLKVNPESPRAFLKAARYEERARRRDAAAKHIATALALAPDDSDVILAAAEMAMNLRKFDEAHALLDRGVAKYPNNEAIYRAQATLALNEDKPAAALEIVQAALKTLPDSQALWLFLADLQLQSRDLDNARKSLDKLDRLDVRQDLVEFMHCRLLVSEEKWLLASQRLERIRPLMVDLPEIAKQIDLLLGEAYERLGQPDRELEVYHKALMRDPTLLSAKLGESRALAAMGNSEMAIDSLTDLVKSLARNKVATPTIVRNQLLQLRISQQLRLPKDRRDWREVEALAQSFVDDPTQTDTQKAIIRAELKFMQDKVDEAKSILLTARKNSPKDLAIWLSLLNLMQRDYDVDKTQKFIDVARKELGDIVPMRIAQANLWARMGGAELPQRLKSLEDGLDKFPVDQQAAFWSDLGNLHYRMRDYDNTRRCWTRVAETRPEDPRLRQTLFELAVEFSKPDDMSEGARQLRRLAGASSSLARYAGACEIVWQVRSKKLGRSALTRARDLLSDARAGRAEWYEVARLGAEIDELDGRADEAIQGYRHALNLSPGHAATARRLVELLYARGRLAEAREAIQLVGATTASDTMRKIDSHIALQTGHADEAMAAAERAVEDAPKDAGNHVWLGQLLDTSGRAADAEREYRAAVELQPASGIYWLLLANHLLVHKKPNQAAEVLGDIERSVPEAERPQTLAQYHELVGDIAAAEQIYLDRLKAEPENSAEMQALASFYQRTKQTPKLEQQLDKLIAYCESRKSDEFRDRLFWARRSKAQLLKTQGDFESLRKAVSVIEANAQAGHYTTEDATLLAGMLGERPEAESRQKAVKLLEHLQAKRPLPDDLHLQLAQLYERAGRWDKAREQLLNLLGRTGNNPQYMAILASLQIKHNEVDDAARWVERVVASQPNTPQSLELKARLLAKQGKRDQAIELVKEFVPEPLPPDQAQRLAQAASILESIGAPELSEGYLRQLVDLEPRTELMLATFLGRHFDLDETFTLFEKSRRSQPLTTVIGAALACMRSRHVDITERQIGQIENWIAIGLAEEPNNSAYRMFQADLYDQTRQVDRVIEAYVNVLKLDSVKPSQAAVVKNNLAFVLALRNRPGDLARAKKLIEEAISVIGPTADVQDTQGIVWLVEGKVSDSVRELTRSVSEGGSAPKYVHLALRKTWPATGAARCVRSPAPGKWGSTPRASAASNNRVTKRSSNAWKFTSASTTRWPPAPSRGGGDARLRYLPFRQESIATAWATIRRRVFRAEFRGSTRCSEAASCPARSPW